MISQKLPKGFSKTKLLREFKGGNWRIGAPSLDTPSLFILNCSFFSTSVNAFKKLIQAVGLLFFYPSDCRVQTGTEMPGAFSALVRVIRVSFRGNWSINRKEMKISFFLLISIKGIDEIFQKMSHL